MWDDNPNTLAANIPEFAPLGGLWLSSKSGLKFFSICRAVCNIVASWTSLNQKFTHSFLYQTVMRCTNEATTPVGCTRSNLGELLSWTTSTVKCSTALAGLSYRDALTGRSGDLRRLRSCHDANFVITVGTLGCLYDNLRCAIDGKLSILTTQNRNPRVVIMPTLVSLDWLNVGNFAYTTF